MVDRLAPGLLGGHVLELPLERAALGLRHLAVCLRDAEVAELDLSLVRNQDVLRGHVAVDDVELAAPVGVVERRGDLARDVNGERNGHRQRDVTAGDQGRAKVGSFDVLHGDEVAARLDFSEVVDVDDVRMIQLRSELRLVREHRDEFVVVRDVRQDLLDRDDLLEALDPGAAGAKDLGHSAARDLLEKLVLAEAIGTLRRDGLPRLRAAGAVRGGVGPDRRPRRRVLRARDLDSQRLRDHPVEVVRARLARRRGWSRRPRRRLHSGERVAKPTLDLLRVGGAARRGGTRRRLRGRPGRDLGGLAPELLQKVGEDVVRRQRPRRYPKGLRLPVGGVQRGPDRGDDSSVGERFRHDLESANLLRVRLRVGPVVSALEQEDGGRLEPPLVPDFPNHVGARHARKLARKEHDVEPAGPERGQPFLAVVGLRDREVRRGEQRADAIAIALFVFDQKYVFCHRKSRLSPGKAL